jgi:hypothetical protein
MVEGVDSDVSDSDGSDDMQQGDTEVVQVGQRKLVDYENVEKKQKEF